MHNIYKASKTLTAINDAIKKDQGALFRKNLGLVISYMSDAFNPEKEEFRSHLGASLIGRDCARELWYGFRWVTKTEYEGRQILLFNRGHLEEARFIAMLLTIGCRVYTKNEQGQQFRISYADGHFGGSCDAISELIPDVPENTACLTEFKTHNDKSFSELEIKGVRNAKFEHYVQMNVYMYLMGLPVALYLSGNKNTDALYGELVLSNKEVAESFLERSENIIRMTSPPKRINESPGFYKCRFCDHRSVCHLKVPPFKTCRSCIYSSPIQDSLWYCERNSLVLDKQKQLAGCEKYSSKDMSE